MTRKSICEKINIADISEEGIITSFDLKYAYCYEITGVNILMMSEEEKHLFSNTLHSGINNIEEGITFEVFNKVEYGNAELIESFSKSMGAPKDEKLTFLAEDAVDHLKSFPQRQHTIYLFVMYDNKYKKPSSSWSFKLFNDLNSQEIRQNRATCLETLTIFESSTLPLLGFEFKRMNGDAIFQVLFNYINTNKACHLTPKFMDTQLDTGPASIYKEFPYLKNVTVRDQLVRSAVDNSESSYIKIDGLYYMTVNMLLLPKCVDINAMQSFTSLPFPHYMSLQVTSPNEAKFTSQLSSISRILFMSNILKTSKHKNNPLDINQKEEIEAVKKTLRLVEDKVFEIRLTFVVYHHELRGCMNKARMIENMCQSQENMQVIIDDHCHLNNFMSLLPCGYQLNERKAGVLGRDLSKLIPVAQQWKGTKDAQIILQNAQRELLPLSFKTEQGDVDVPNTLIAGKPGQGKSWVTNYLMKSLQIYNPKTFFSIIDNGGSYKKQYALFEDRAAYIEMDYREDCAFNYFSEKRIVMESDASYGRYKTYMGNLLYLTVQQEGDPEYSESQKYIIEKGINQLYDSIVDKDIPLLEDFQHIASTMEPRDEEDESFIKTLVKNLDSYTDSKQSKSKIFNRKSSISLDKQMLFVDIQNIDQDPKFQAIYNFMINKQMRDRMIYFPEWRQVIIFDEVWKAWKEAKSKEFQEEAGRKGRKNDTSIILLSQNIADFASEDIAPIRNACPIHFIFKTEDTDTLKEAPFSYNENKISAIKQMSGEKGKSSQFFIKWGPHSTIAHVEGSKIDGEICSTDATTRLKYDDIYNNQDTDMFSILKQLKKETI